MSKPRRRIAGETRPGSSRSGSSQPRTRPGRLGPPRSGSSRTRQQGSSRWGSSQSKSARSSSAKSGSSLLGGPLRVLRRRTRSRSDQRSADAHSGRGEASREEASQSALKFRGRRMLLALAACLVIAVAGSGFGIWKGGLFDGDDSLRDAHQTAAAQAGKDVVTVFSYQYDSLDTHLTEDRKSTRLNSSHVAISYAVFC